ncbi:NADH dehydrogenase 1 beta subcomplex subunit 2 domain-containing protein [Ditylenchus destructor]|uniref:NADH dehydrogenase 1 beta subcomplex subunit 2 domain-containing protein n=1 Tax=Ditylenchus destructor TaxID=166010 RepID=A0AAD4N7Q1_9BILA|nr:NADH dehydrogenase 1 beta subcomplex subunit 2 domain-containing protein [Ditylenchus destructor]
MRHPLSHSRFLLLRTGRISSSATSLFRNPMQVSPFISRSLCLAVPRLKWVSGKEAEKGGLFSNSWQRMSHPDNPEFFTRDKEYYHEDHPTGWTYRERGTKPMKIERTLLKWLSGFTWFWIFYQFYWRPGMMFGEFYMPYLDEFTDEELGIPPDDAPDPEYWGNHGNWAKQAI